MQIDTLLAQVRDTPESVEFEDVMTVIARHYDYVPTLFRNGSGDDRVVNPAGTNAGSCKLFAFARLHGLDKAQTLACFGRFYREDVLQHPYGSDHANIRTFMRHGPEHIWFERPPLVPRADA